MAANAFRIPSAHTMLPHASILTKWIKVVNKFLGNFCRSRFLQVKLVGKYLESFWKVLLKRFTILILSSTVFITWRFFNHPFVYILQDKVTKEPFQNEKYFLVQIWAMLEILLCSNTVHNVLLKLFKDQ